MYLSTTSVQFATLRPVAITTWWPVLRPANSRSAASVAGDTSFDSVQSVPSISSASTFTVPAGGICHGTATGADRRQCKLQQHLAELEDDRVGAVYLLLL